MPNLRLAFRTLFKSPFIALVAILSLALGIGANSAIFSLFDQMLMRPLPVPSPEELVNLGAPGPKPGSQSCGQAGSCEEIFSYPMFRDLERVQTSFTGLAAHRPFGASLGYQGTTLGGEGLLVSGSYFPVLGLNPAIGRLFTPEDDKTIASHFVVVLSLRVLAQPFRAQPVGPEPDAHRQWPGDDHRRRRPSRLQRHHARPEPRRVRADHDARVDVARLQRLREPPAILGLCVRPRETRRVDGTGHRRDQRAVSAPSSTTSKRRCRRG